MGIYHEYIDRPLDPKDLDVQRREQLARIGILRNSAVLSYAARMSWMPVQAPTSVLFEDILPFSDMLGGLSGDRVSVVLETPGGVGEAGRRMVEMLHDRFTYVEFIVPGMAMSTGTIMVLGGNEILMGPASALGPIDAQLTFEGKQFSADALIEGFERIKTEVNNDPHGRLNPAYIPILQRLSPGDLQHAHHALEFAREAVTDWLTKYKFADWTTHSSTGAPVTDEERKAKARAIAEALSSQSRWRSHGRTLSIGELKSLGLKITDYSADTNLSDAVQRYYSLLRMTLDFGTAYKIIEVSDKTFARQLNLVAQPTPAGLPGAPIAAAPPDTKGAIIQAVCARCGTQTLIQVDFEANRPLQQSAVRFPPTGHLACPKCSSDLDLTAARAELERQVGRPIYFEPGP